MKWLAALSLVLLIGLGHDARAVTLVGTPCESYDSDQNTTITVSCAVGAGTNLAIVVGYGLVHLGGTATQVGCTYNSVPLTQVATPAGLGVDTTGLTALYVLADPDVGTFDVVCTASGTNNEQIVVVSVFSDVSQSGPFTGTDSDADNGLSAALTPTVAGSNVGIDMVVYYAGATASVAQSDTIIHESEASLASSGYSAQRGDGTLTSTFGAASQWSAMATALVHDATPPDSNDAAIMRRRN
jgi:hypothetical protein